MKKMKKFLVLLLAMAMVVAMATGCSKKSASKKGGNGSDITATFTATGKVADEGEFSFTMTTKSNGSKADFGMKGSITFDGQTYEVNSDQLMVCADDKIYFNVKDIVTLATYCMAASGEDDYESYVDSVSSAISTDWAYIELKGISSGLAYDDSLSSDLDADFIKAFADFGTSTDNSVSFSIESADDVAKFVSTLATLVSDNVDTIADYMVNQENKIDTEAMLDNLLDQIVDVMADMYSSYGMEMSDDDKQTYKDQIKGQVGTTTTISKDVIVEELNEVVDELNELDTSDFEDGAKISVDYSTSDNGKNATVTCSADDVEFTITSAVDTSSSVSISVPSDATNIMDAYMSIITAMMN